MPDRPRTLIEDWLPVEELGVESQRERSASSALPPLYFLHVWWARRPLTAARAAVMGSLLPTWSDTWPDELRRDFPDEASYHRWFLGLLGIRGDPIAARRRIDYANAHGIKLPPGPYGYPRAFTTSPSPEDAKRVGQLLKPAWGESALTVLDPMAGGGSIPFEGLRFGFTTLANELNPVASLILSATLDFPARYGPEFAQVIERYGRQVRDSVESRLGEYYPRHQGESILAYVWARTVACPQTGKPVPLSPNWYLQMGADPVAVRLVASDDAQVCQFEIVRGTRAVAAVRPELGTVRRGDAISPWTGEVIDGDYIKREAQGGRMGEQLYAVATKGPAGRTFRSPGDDENIAAARAASEFARCRTDLVSRRLIPDEPIPEGNKTAEPLRYGMSHWSDLFSPRQLLAHATIVEELRTAASAATKELGPERGKALAVYLAFALDKCLNYNSLMSVWHPTRSSMANTFDRHDLSTKWTHGEFDAAHNLWPWALSQIVDAYAEISKLSEPARQSLWTGAAPAVDRLTVMMGNAASLPSIASGSVALVCVDPPYEENVQYAELSDFFYVWLKRTVGDYFPDLFAANLTDKDDEAVSNPARFAAFGPRRKVLALQDYQRKMAAAFREMHRVLRDDGVLTVMFTHKKVQAWDALASALITAGFRIETSWPIHTESEHSLHQAKKNAASSTILLVCRKRDALSEPTWWEDIKGRVRETVRERARAFADQGIHGVDLYISTFGPALAVVSEHWPVWTSEVDEKTGQPRELRAETALDLAREEVIGLRKEGLLLGRTVRFDPVTDWYVTAWDAFGAVEFPADEARKLAIAVGIDDVENVLVRRERIITKKQSTVVLQTPTARRKRDVVDPEADFFPSLIDSVHTAMLLFEADGSHACEAFLRRHGYLTDGTFRACLQALLNAIPRTKDRRGFVRPEAAVLDGMRAAFYPDLVVPPEPEIDLGAVSTVSLWGDVEAESEPLGDEEGDEDDEDQ
jgi:adenine-specific DNA methylase